MKSLRFKQVDVFTTVPFRGNPVAVVLEADGLSGEEMQRIAGWTNLSETTFVLQPSVAGADYCLRIFTPRHELPFAGHPTIGSAHAAIEAGIVKPRSGRFRQQCAAGVLDLTEERGVIQVKAPPQVVTPLDAAKLPELEKILGTKVLSPPRIVAVGPVWLVADLGSAHAVDGLVPDMAAIGAFTESIHATGMTVFGATGKPGAAVHVRSFAPAQGVPEDPVCGSGNISVAAFLRDTGQLRRYGESYRSRQGMQMGRDGSVSIEVRGGEVFLGGNAVTCVEGALRVQ
ncbi:MAG: PhzF family phenazine biosynthesis protein [Betaproteobacteria bacterium]